MGNCQTHTPQVEPQLQLPALHQLQMKKVKTKCFKQKEQLFIPIDHQPELTKEVHKRIQKLGPFNYQKCTKHQRGKVLRPHKFLNEAIYVGEWYDGKPHGRGKYYLPDHSLFEGIVFQNEIEGFGRIIHENGDYFEGQLKSGQANGNGTYVQGDITYEGSFKDNLQHGEGVQYNGFYQFKGEFLEGEKRKGKLIMKSKNKYEYEGEFKNNKYHGFGVLVDGLERYEGYFSKGLKNGSGKLSDNEEFLFQGQFKNNHKHGRGKVFNKNGKLISEEFWENGKLIN